MANQIIERIYSKVFQKPHPDEKQRMEENEADKEKILSERNREWKLHLHKNLCRPLFFTHGLKNHAKFEEDIKRAFDIITPEKLTYLLGVYFKTDVEQKVIAVINFTALARENRSFNIPITEIIELFAMHLSSIEDEKSKTAYNIEFSNNMLFYKDKTNTKEIDMLRVKDNFEHKILYYFRVPYIAPDTFLIENTTEDVVQLKVETMSIASILCLANTSIRRLESGNQIEALKYMVLALAKAREVEYQFSEADNFRYQYLYFLHKTDLRQAVGYILRTNDFIMIPFETHKAELEKVERDGY